MTVKGVKRDDTQTSSVWSHRLAVQRLLEHLVCSLGWTWVRSALACFRSVCDKKLDVRPCWKITEGYSFLQERPSLLTCPVVKESREKMACKQETVEEVQDPADEAVKTFKHRLADQLDSSPATDSQDVCTDIRETFEVVSLLGTGMFGRIFLAKHKQSQREVALKLCSFRRLTRGLADLRDFAMDDHKENEPRFDPEVIESRVGQLRLEKILVRSLSGLSAFVLGLDEGVDTISVCDLAKGELGFATEIMAGCVITVWGMWENAIKLTRQRSIGFKDYNATMVFLAAQMTEAVRFLHSCSVVHLDINVGNVLIDRHGYVKLSDFGRSYVEELPSPGNNNNLDNSSLSEQLSSKMSALNDVTKIVPKFFGPPEDMWLCRYGQQRGRVTLGRATDLHMLGYSLRTLDFPLDDTPNYADIRYDIRQPNFAKFAETYRFVKAPKTIRGDLLDYIEKLTAPAPADRLGFSDTEKLLRHKVFEGKP